MRRPWGSYESLRVGETFQVKHIVVDVAGRTVLVNLAGRGDKDVAQMMEILA